jgi:hypothetical protein
MQGRVGSLTGALAVLAALSSVASAQVAQESVDLAVVQQIREEGLERSQIPDLARYLTEVIGPRLTGSPAMRQANNWTADAGGSSHPTCSRSTPRRWGGLGAPTE